MIFRRKPRFLAVITWLEPMEIPITFLLTSHQAPVKDWSPSKMSVGFQTPKFHQAWNRNGSRENRTASLGGEQKVICTKKYLLKSTVSCACCQLYLINQVSVGVFSFASFLTAYFSISDLKLVADNSSPARSWLLQTVATFCPQKLRKFWFKKIT